ncbi:MAG TPA: type II toxin-antitoxin system PemK/MazF family toxin [Egibacteraceae bacterium]|nr:type II toxin-antitoxin system PemK/MazF family toxin [Egibacteraceae bacterium]
MRLELGVPAGSEAGLARPAVIVTAQRVLMHQPRVVQVVPLTATLRGYDSEVTVTADPDNGLEVDSAAQCQHIRAVATERLVGTLGNVGGVALARIPHGRPGVRSLPATWPRC